MSNEYYIISDNNQSGPYDIVALVIKIRNGSLNEYTSIQRGDSQEVKPAREWDELKEFFASTAGGSKKEAPQKLSDIKKLYLMQALSNGLNFLQQNQISTVYSGILILLMITIISGVNLTLPDEMHVLGYIVGFIALYFMLSCYMFIILRMTRGQQINLFQIIKKIQPSSFKLLCASIPIFLPIIIGIILFTYFEDNLLACLIGLLIIIIPGMFIITIYSFASLLIIDQGYGAWEAMRTSRQLIMKSGLDNLGVYFALNTINLIAGLCMIFPMAVTLPVTMSAITESYDESLN